MDERASAIAGRNGKPPWWRRPSLLIVVGAILLLIVVAAMSGDPNDAPDDRAARPDAATPTPTPSPTVDPQQEARADAAELAAAGRFGAAAERLENVGLTRAADRILARGSRALYRQARRALSAARYAAAKRLAVMARSLRSTSAITALITEADAEIAAVRAAARIERDQRTCTSTEKDTMQAGGGVPTGCDTYAADLAARRAAEAAEEQQEQEEQEDDSGCAPGYSPCIPPYPPDLNCPDVGPVTVTGSDPHGLDADNDGVACGGD